MGRFLAVAEMWGAWHVLRWHNIRFYVNPVTLKLEPIAFDANTGDGWRRSPFVHRQSWYFHYLVTDPAIRESFIMLSLKELQMADDRMPEPVVVFIFD